MKQSKDREEQDKKDSAAASSADESEISAFYRQKKIISDTIPQDQRHLLDGLLYYRVRKLHFFKLYICIMYLDLFSVLTLFQTNR